MEAGLPFCTNSSAFSASFHDHVGPFTGASDKEELTDDPHPVLGVHGAAGSIIYIRIDNLLVSASLKLEDKRH